MAWCGFFFLAVCVVVYGVLCYIIWIVLDEKCRALVVISVTKFHMFGDIEKYRKIIYGETISVTTF